MATNENTPVPALPAGHRRLIIAGAAALALLLGACAESPGIAEVAASGEAIGAAREPIARSPDSLIRLADAALAMGDRGGAVRLYDRAANAAPGDSELQVRLGFVLHDLAAQLEAEAAFRRAVTAEFGNADALRGLGITLISRDMPHHAIEYLEEAIAARPDSRAYNAMGVALDMVGERGTAREAYKAGLAADPENLSLLNNLGLSLTLSGRYADAIAILGRAAEDPNATPRHRQNLALAYGLAGRPEMAADVANTDLDMGSVRNNLGYYAWLRRQPGEIADQALATNLDTTAAIQSAEAVPAPVFAPGPPVARGAPPMSDGALLAGGPLVLTPDPRTGSLYDGPSEAGVVTESTYSEPRNQAPREVPSTRSGVVWELQSVETDDPAAKDADGKETGGKDANKNGETLPESEEYTPSDGSIDESAAGTGGELPEPAAKLPETATAMAESTDPADEYAIANADLALTSPRAAVPMDSRFGRRAATEAVPPAAAPLPAQIAALSPDEVARDTRVDDGMPWTTPAADHLPADDMAIELPTSGDSGAIRDAAEEFDANIAALPRPAESTAPRLAASPKTAAAGDREEYIGAPPPDTLIDGAETGEAGTGGIAASRPQPALLADRLGVEAAPYGAALSVEERPADAVAVHRPPGLEATLETAREIGEIDPSPPPNNDATAVAGGSAPSDAAAETVGAAPRGIANPPAKSAANGAAAARAGGPAGASPAADAVTPPESHEYNTIVVDSDVNTPLNTPPETVLALAPPPQDPTPGPIAATSQPPDSPPLGNRSAAGAMPVDPPPGRLAERFANSTPLLRSGKSLVLERPPSVREERHDLPRQLASAEPAGGAGVGRALVGSLTPADRGAAPLATASAAPGGATNAGVSAPVYGLAALILAGLLLILWSRRRGLGRSDRGTHAESDLMTDTEADFWGGQ